MKIGILSDMHNDRQTLVAALKVFARENIRTVICCGDVTDPDLIALFAGLELHLVEGNIDHDPKGLSRAAQRLGNGSTFGLGYSTTLDGKRLIALHGHLADVLNDAIRSGLFDYVLHGHTHRRRDERSGRTRLINPGALGGTRHEPRSCAVLDVGKDQLRFIEIGG